MKILAPPPAGRRHPGTNLEYAKGYNQRVMLQAIRLHGPFSRAALAQLLKPDPGGGHPDHP